MDRARSIIREREQIKDQAWELDQCRVTAADALAAAERERLLRYAEDCMEGASGDGALEIAAAGRYGFAGVGTHQLVIALRDVVLPAGESFAITRAIMAELYPHGQLLSYEGGDPGAFREQARTRLGVDPADADRWKSARQFWCPARLLDIVLANYGEWLLRQGD